MLIGRIILFGISGASVVATIMMLLTSGGDFGKSNTSLTSQNADNLTTIENESLDLGITSKESFTTDIISLGVNAIPSVIDSDYNFKYEYYVATSGSDNNSGSFSQPFKSIQHACEVMEAGSVLYIREGTYKEKIYMEVSGTANDPIVIRPYENERVIVTSDQSGDDAIFYIENKDYIQIIGLEIANNSDGETPSGIMVEGSGSGYVFADNKVYGMTSNNNAHGIVFYGTDAKESLSNILIRNNEIYNNILGTSESLVLNGNVENFLIESNAIHDNNNIGIDCIGYEETADYNDFARNGVIRNNIVYNISDKHNPAYDDGGSAVGIYVDGGSDITIEYNQILNCDIGIEVASENYDGRAENVLVQYNLVGYSSLYGISLGGSDSDNGLATNNTVTNNVLVANDVDLNLQKASGNELTNNYIYSNGIMLEKSSITGSNQITLNDAQSFGGETLDYGQLLYNLGLIQGNGVDLDYNGVFTREALVTILWRIEGSPSINATNPFTDITSSHWAYDAVNWAYNEGVTKGVGGNAFGLGQAVTYQQLETFMLRTLGYDPLWEEAINDAGLLAIDSDEASNSAVLYRKYVFEVLSKTLVQSQISDGDTLINLLADTYKNKIDFIKGVYVQIGLEE